MEPVKFKFRVSGRYACFTRKELIAERVTYDVPTPSALRGILTAVYWKPGFDYVIDGIQVLNPVKHMNVMRNEVKSKIPSAAVRSTMKGKAKPLGINVEQDRTQRSALCLRDVDYVVEAHIVLGEPPEHGEERHMGPVERYMKHYSIVTRRLSCGQHFKQPYLGCREFPADVSLVCDDDVLPAPDPSLMGEFDLGYMLYDMETDWTGWEKCKEKASPLWYRPVMRDGYIDVEGTEVVR